jgi:hypothetical protein
MDRPAAGPPAYDLGNFTLRHMSDCGEALRKTGAGARSMEEVAQRVVRHLYDGLRAGPNAGRACALVRFFKTHAYEDLNTGLRRFARRMLGGVPAPPGMKCLTLLATAGDQPAWNDRRASAGHQAIPLPSADLVVQSPMISQLVQQLGLELDTMLRPDPALLVDMEQKAYNVFHVPDARASCHVPAQQEFVIPFGIRSVLGFGGMLPSGNLFVVILFARTAIARETADLFRPLAPSVKLAVLPFDGHNVFEDCRLQI